MFNNILFVCIGNICRSPMAEYLLKHKLSDKPNIIIRSAGVSALVDHPIENMAGELLLENGIDASSHIARQLNTQMLVEADLVLTMDRELINSISDLSPLVSGKVFLLSKWSNGTSIGDPYHKSREAFEFVYNKIDTFTDNWVRYF